MNDVFFSDKHFIFTIYAIDIFYVSLFFVSVIIVLLTNDI